MGEAAEDVLDGIVCEGCGEFFDDILNGLEPPGYPRRCEACEPVTINQATSVLPYPCPGCGRSFKHRGDLRQHQRTKRHKP